MSEKIPVFKAGELLAISKGEYSDYCINGLFRLLTDFNPQKELLAWAKETGRKVVEGVAERDRSNKNIDYLGWLNKSGFIEDVAYRELHIGDYGETELSDYSEYRNAD